MKKRKRIEDGYIWYVRQKDSNVCDCGDGTAVAPFAAISQAANAAKSGDTVLVGDGTYRETLNPIADDVKFIVDTGCTAVIMPAEGYKPAADKWKLVDECARVYEQKADMNFLLNHGKEKDGKFYLDTGSLNMIVDDLCVEYVQVAGIGVNVNFGNGEHTYYPIDKGDLKDNELNRWTVTSSGLIQINLDDRNPADCFIELIDGKFSAVKLDTDGCLVKGFTIKNGYKGFEITGSENTITDCMVYGPYYGATIMDTIGSYNIIRRNTFRCCKQGVFIADSPGYNIVEENFFIGTGQAMLNIRSPQNNVNEPWGPGTSIRYSSTHYNVFRYNVIADGAWAGWWPDVNCYGSYFYGNLIWNIRDRGIYNEYPVNDSRIYYNSIIGCDSGIIQRFSWRTMNLYNYLDGNRNEGFAIWGPHVDNPYRFDNLFARNIVKGSKKAFVYQDHQGLSGNLPVALSGEGKISASALSRIKSNFIEDNIYGPRAKGGIFADFNGVQYKTLDEFRDKMGLERGSVEKEDPCMEELGLRLFHVRIPYCAKQDEAVPFIGNPLRDFTHSDLLPFAAEDAPYFWFQGDAAVTHGGHWWNGIYGFSYEWPNFHKAVQRFIRFESGANPEQVMKEGSLTPVIWLECVSNIPDQIPVGGSGFWSISMPTVADAEIELSMQIKGKDISPMADSGGPVIFMRFWTLTGEELETTEVLGGRNGSETLTGTFDWTAFKTKAKAPAGAGRFSVFLGLRPCSKGGTVYFGDIALDTHHAEVCSCDSELAFDKAEPLDISEWYNHDLDADTGAPESPQEVDKFITSYCHLPKIDLFNKPKGYFEAGRIPYIIEKSVTLGCHRRPPVTLPFSADGIKVGKKLKGILFFHAGPPRTAAQENYRYIVQYENGKQVEVVPVEEEVDLNYKQPYFLSGRISQEELQAAVSCRIGSPYQTFLWSNPCQEVIVSAFDFKSMDAGQAVLLAVTLLL